MGGYKFYLGKVQFYASGIFAPHNTVRLVVFNQQAEAVAMEGAEHWTRCQARSSSSLEEPLVELANMNMSPQPKLIAEFFHHIGSAGLWPRSGQAAGA